MPLTSALNESMIQAVSDHFGSGMLGIFGSILIVGLFIIIIALALLYIMGFTLEVILPVMIVLVAAMASRLPGAQYPVLPSWTAPLIGMIVAAVIFFAFMKFIKR